MSLKPAPRPVQGRFIYEIADDIYNDWPAARNPNHPAGHYVAAMRDILYITDSYYADTAKTVVMYFLSNAATWRGDLASKVKKELRALI